MKTNFNKKTQVGGAASVMRIAKTEWSCVPDFMRGHSGMELKLPELLLHTCRDLELAMHRALFETNE